MTGLAQDMRVNIATTCIIVCLLPGLGAYSRAQADERAATVTAIDGANVYLMPVGKAGWVAPGCKLVVQRNGRPIATLIVQDGEPLHASAESPSDVKFIVIGDKCYAPGQVGGADKTERSPVPGAQPPAASEADAPGTLPPVARVTAVEEQAIYLSPIREKILEPGAKLAVMRAGEAIAVAQMHEGEPYSADLIGARPGVTPRVGDLCALASEELQLPPPVSAHIERPQGMVVARRTSNVSRREEAPDLAPSTLGPTGIIRMPSAEVQPTGRGIVAITGVPEGLDQNIPGNRDQEQYVLGIFPRVEVGNTLAEYFDGWDITAHAKVQLLTEELGWPAVAVGAAELARNELVGGSQSNVLFGVASKHLLDDRLRVSLGYASRGLTGLFGGVELGAGSQVTLLGEYDTRHLNYGVRLTPTDRIHVAAVHREGGFGLQLGYGWATMSEGRQPPPDVNIIRPTGTPDDWQEVVSDLQEALVHLGLENVRVTVCRENGNYKANVEYENRRYSHNELYALGRVLAVAASALPESISELKVIIKRLDLPIATCSIDLGEYVDFMGGETTAEAFQRHIKLTYGASPPSGEIVAVTKKASPSRGRIDLTLHPDLTTRLGTESVHIATGWALEPELKTTAAPGLVLSVKSHFPIAGPLREQEPSRVFDQALLAKTLWLADNVLARGHIGRFPQRLDGFYGEAIYLAPSGRHLIGLSGGSLRHRFGSSILGWDTTAVARYRYSIPRHDLFLGMTFGRYLQGDWGVTGTIRRDLGDAILVGEIAKSGLGSRAGLRLQIPIGSGVDVRPRRLRPRIPGYVEHGFLVGMGGTEDIDRVNLIAREADPGATLLGDVLNRDRLNSGYLQEHLRDLKRTGGRGLQETPAEK